MARIRSNILNRWGTPGGVDPQRADLWQVDLSAAVAGLRAAGAGWCPESVPPYFAASITLPELKVKADMYRRDSRAYQMPGYDEPLDSVKIMFHLDDARTTSTDESVVGQSVIYRLLDLWRKVVRAGRGGVGAEESLVLNDNYTIDYAFPIYVYLCRGYGLPPKSLIQTTRTARWQQLAADFSQDETVTPVPSTQSVAGTWELFNNQMEQGLYLSGILKLEWAWLSSFRVGELTYNGSTLTTLESTFYCENIFQESTDPLAK